MVNNNEKIGPRDWIGVRPCCMLGGFSSGRTSNLRLVAWFRVHLRTVPYLA